MGTWQERMRALADEAIRPVMERLAQGAEVDEGERPTDWEGLHPELNRYAEDRPARVEWDADARLWLIENAEESVPAEFRAALRAAVRDARARKDYVALQRIAADFENPAWVPNAKNAEDVPEYAADGDARDLKTVDFYTEVMAGAATLVRDGWSRHKWPEREYMRRKAAEEARWSRSGRAERGSDKSEKEIAFDKAFNKLQKRFHDQQKKLTARRRALTPPLPT